MIDTGKAQVDLRLFDALRKLGVSEPSALELARLDTFGGQDTELWITGLEHAAAAMNCGCGTLDWGTLPDPWPSVGQALGNAEASDLAAVLAGLTLSLRPEVATALIEAIATTAAAQAEKASAHKPADLSAPLNASQAAAAIQSTMYLVPIDPALCRRILGLLKAGQKDVDADRRRKVAGEAMLEWLAAHGRFVRAKRTNQGYYLHRDSHQLFALDTPLWRGWLYKLTGVNPSSTDYAYLKADCETAVIDGEQVEIVRVSHWDGSFLRVSRFDGMVYRLDGDTIELEANGDGPVIFEDGLGYQPYSPDFSGDGSALAWWPGLLNVEKLDEERRYAIRAWLLTTFFIELCPTQVILVLFGEAGSGKSMLLRVLLKLLFGAVAQLSGVPDKPDGFTAAAAATHLLVMDNLDRPEDWLQDKLARISTGGIDYYRQLYTSNTLGTVVYRTHLAITSRTPDTLRRDDLADRVLVIPVDRIAPDDRQKEGNFLVKSLSIRSLWWGDLLRALNRVVSTIRSEGLPSHSSMRMADFEVLGRTIARAESQEELWNRVVKDWGSQQAQMLLADSEITDGLETWLSTPANRSRRVDTRTLHQELELGLFGTNRPSPSWPRSARSFGRILAGLRRALQSGFQVRWEEVGRRTYYTFDLKP